MLSADSAFYLVLLGDFLLCDIIVVPLCHYGWFSIVRTFVFPLLLLLTSVSSAEVYRWVDANGNTVFGDSPPEQSKAQTIELPTLTVADSYDDGAKKTKQTTTAQNSEEEEATSSQTIEYKRFAVASPEKNQAVRANNGNVMVRLELEPELQAGHGIVVYLDGKQVANGDATTFSLESVDRGKHSLFAVLHDANDDVLKNTEAVSFDVLRHSVLKKQ